MLLVFFPLIAFDILSSIDLIFGLLRAKGTLILSNIFGILYAIFTFIGISFFKLEDFSLILWKRFFLRLSAGFLLLFLFLLVLDLVFF